jgi:replication factor A1
MQTQEIAPHLETLTKALGNKIGNGVTREDLEAELKKYLEYGVPVEQAINTILRHHGEATTPAVTPDGENTPLGSLPAQGNVNVLARVLSMGNRTVNARGEEKTIFVGQLSDETGTTWYTSWRPLDGLERGDVIEVKGAYTKEFRGEIQVNFGDRTQITKKPTDAIEDKGIQLDDKEVADLQDGNRGFRITGRFLDVSTREIQVQGSPKMLWSGHFADTSGKIEFTCWDDCKLEENAVVTIEGAYVRSFRGMPQLNFDKSASINPFEGEFAKADELDITTIWPIHKALAQGDVGDLAVRGTLLEVRPGSGLVFRDPETNRVVPGGQGMTPDLRIKGIMDDGSGCMTIIATREITEKLLGKTLEACVDEAKAAFPNGDELILRQLQDKLAGRVFVAEGFLRTDEFGPMFISRSLKEDLEDAEDSAAEILETMEAT